MPEIPLAQNSILVLLQSRFKTKGHEYRGPPLEYGKQSKERKSHLPAHLSKVPNSDLPSSNQPENK